MNFEWNGNEEYASDIDIQKVADNLRIRNDGDTIITMGGELKRYLCWKVSGTVQFSVQFNRSGGWGGLTDCFNKVIVNTSVSDFTVKEYTVREDQNCAWLQGNVANCKLRDEMTNLRYSFDGVQGSTDGNPWTPDLDNIENPWDSDYLCAFLCKSKDALYANDKPETKPIPPATGAPSFTMTVAADYVKSGCGLKSVVLGRIATGSLLSNVGNLNGLDAPVGKWNVDFDCNPLFGSESLQLKAVAWLIKCLCKICKNTDKKTEEEKEACWKAILKEMEALRQDTTYNGRGEGKTVNGIRQRKGDENMFERALAQVPKPAEPNVFCPSCSEN